MNAHLHRIVFNAARGMRMVVQETAKSAGKATGATAAVAVTALASMLVPIAASAQIAGAMNVPNTLRPTVLVAPNGVPLVNIQTPSAAGVSRNIYGQFDVGTNGAILNNSRATTSTQLGGYIQGNPYLATGPARIILNEVNSGNPSQLRGYVEIAGQRAEIIIANPAGINVDGAGFINASRATLTTGTPQFSPMGGLDSFLVRGGTVSIDGAGIDFSKTDYAAILARAVNVNASIYATELKVVTGANQISADHSQITPVAGAGPAPTFALDVAALGGMYAGKITLIGSEAGLGVRNAGNIGASAGSLIVTAAGRLENTGTLEGQSVQLTTPGDIDNRGGTIRQTSSASLAITAPTLSNTAGGWIGAEPVAVSTGGGTTGTSTGGTPTGTPSTGTGATSGGASTGSTGATTAYVPPAPGVLTAGGAILSDGGKIYAGGPITLQTQNLINNGGALSVASMALNQPSFSNQGGTLNVSGALTANVGTFDNSTGTLHAGSLNINTSGDLLNVDGTLTSDSDASLTVGGKIDNTRGTISAAGALGAQVVGATHNAAGTLSANQGLTLSGASLDNSGKGVVQSAQGNIQLAFAQQLANNGGIVSAARDVSIQAGSITSDSASVLAAGVNTDGVVIVPGSGNLAVATTQGLASNGSNFVGGNASFTGASVDLSGSQTSAANIAITATQGNVTTSGATVVAGSAAMPGSLTINANNSAGQSLVNQSGRLNAAQVQINAGAIDNSNFGQTAQTGTGTFQITTTGAINNSAGGRITSAGAVDVQAGQGVNNNLGLIASNGAVNLQAASLNNDGGTVASSKGSLIVNTFGATSNRAGYLQAANNLSLQSTGLNNNLGSITAGSDVTHSLTLDTRQGALSSVGGTIASAGGLGISSGALASDGGLIQSGAVLSIDTHGQTLSNSNAANYATGKGGIVSQDTLTIQSGNLDNTAGFIGSKNALSATTGQLTNSNGQIIGQATSTLTTTGFTNNGGQVQSVGDLGLSAGAATLDNTSGLLRSSGTTALSAGTVHNNSTTGIDQGIEGNNVSITAVGAAGAIGNQTGAIRATQNVALTSAGTIDNAAGLLSAGDTLTLKDPNAANPAAMTLVVTNTGGTAIAGKALNINAASVTQDGQLLSQGDLTLSQRDDINVAAGGQMIANGNLTLNTSGNVTNAGKIVSGQSLTIGAANLDNQATGEISSAVTTLNISNALTNRGLIDGGITTIHAGTVTNIGTGRIYGDQLSIGAGTLNNVSETVNGVTSAGTIAARQRLDLGVGTLNNLDGALIYSGGDAFIGGALDASGHATGAAALINNKGATIQAAGNLGINATALNNTNAGVTWTMQAGATSAVHNQYQAQGSLQRLDASQVLYTTGPFFLADLTETAWPNTHAAPATASAPYAPDQFHGFIYTGVPPYTLDSPYRPYLLNSPQNSQDLSYCKPITIDTCQDMPVPGAWYPTTDPIWGVFGVAPPDASSPGWLDRNIHVGQTQYQVGLNQWVDFPGGPVTQAQVDQWYGAHGALDTATKTMIQQVKQFSTNQFTVWNFTETGQTPVLTSSAPGQILSGGAMALNIGSGTNASSQIVAGGNLSITGGSFTNTATQVDAVLTRTGTVYTNSPISALPYNDTTPTSVTLAAPRQEGNTAVGGGYTVGGLNTGNTSQTAAGAGVASGSLRGASIGNPNSGGSSAVHPIVQVSVPTGVIRTAVPNTTLPTASLFQFRTGAGSHYLIETDPRFAGYKQWLSSDYLLNNLGLDPNNTLKRLGDGFYEQQLITQQVMQLTGQRYLTGYASDVDEYTALMTAGVTFAQQYHLTVGVALTAEQMAQLTSDIVWLVAQDVTLPDGTVQRVLVPQVYVRAQPGDLDGSSGILAGNTVKVNLTGDLTNSATIAGRKSVSLTAENIANAGRISGDNVSAKATVDLNNIGGVITGQTSVALGAGRDLNITSTTRSNVSGTASASNPIGHTLATTQIEHAAGVYVTGTGKPGSGSLSLDAGRDVNINGATVSNTAGKVNISAGRDVNLGTVDTERKESDVSSTYTDGRFAPNFQISGNSVQVGSTISASGDVNIAAGNNLNAVGTHIASSEGSVLLGAKNDVNIVSAGQLIEGYQAQTNGNKGVAGQAQILNNLPATITAAKNVTIDAGHDINIAGAHIAAGADARTQAQILADSQPLDTTKPVGYQAYQDTLGKPKPTVAPTTGTVTLTAGHDVNLMANGLQSSTSHEADLGSGNYNKGDGSTQALQPTTISGATVSITAGHDLTSVASSVTAGTVNLTAGNNLNLLAATLQNNHSASGYDGDSMTIDQSSRGGKDQSTVYNQINAGTLNVSVGGQINAQIGGSTSIQDLASQPGMGWINTLMNDPANAGRVTWQRIEENHEHWGQSSSTLGPVAQAVLVAVVTFATWGAGTSSVGLSAETVQANAALTAIGTGTDAATAIASASSLSGTGLAGSFGLSASTAAAITPAVQAAITSIATQAAVSFANNNGDMAAVLHDLSSSQGVRNILSAIATAGVVQGLDSALDIGGWNMASYNAGTVSLPQVLAHNLIDSTAASIVNAAVRGTSLEDAIQHGLVEGMINTGAAAGANFIGQNGPGTVNSTFNAFTAQVAHAIVGCVAGAARSSGAGVGSGTGCSAGAIGAVIGELAAQAYNPDPASNLDPNGPGNTLALTQLISSIAGAIVGGGQAAANIAAAAGLNAVENNWLSAKQNAAKEAALKACATTPGCDPLKVINFWDNVDIAQQRITDDLKAAKDAVQRAAQSNDPAAQRAAAVQLDTALTNAHALQQSFAGVDPYAANFVGNMIASAQGAATQAQGMAACVANKNDCIATTQGTTNFLIGLGMGVVNSPIDALNIGPTAVNGYGYVSQLITGGALSNAVDPLPYWPGMQPEGSLQALGNTVGSVVTTSVVMGVTSVALDAAAARGPAAAVVQEAAGSSAASGTILDGAGGAASSPRTIPYQPNGSFVSQGTAPVCGPACAAMTITDNTGIAVSLQDSIGSFQNGIRPTGVSTTELSVVINNAGVRNTVNTTLLPSELNQALNNGSTVIVNINNHFIIVDSISRVDGVLYYMTRDPFVGPRGVQASVLDNAMVHGVNAIVVGK